MKTVVVSHCTQSFFLKSDVKYIVSFDSFQCPVKGYNVFLQGYNVFLQHFSRPGERIPCILQHFSKGITKVHSGYNKDTVYFATRTMYFYDSFQDPVKGYNVFYSIFQGPVRGYNVFWLLWAALGCPGLLWAALGSSGVLWGALGCSGAAL